MKNHKYNNTVIEVLSIEHGEKVKEWWRKQGIDTFSYIVSNNPTVFYGLKDGNFKYFSQWEVDKYGLKVIELPTEQPKPYPKMMLVANNTSTSKVPRFVLCEIEGKYVAVYGLFVQKKEHFLKQITMNNHKDLKINIWDHATDIEEPQEVELTLEQIADKFGLNVSQIKIKK